MQQQLINCYTLYAGCIAGAKEVIKHKDHLNMINVFPVADGDTGTNLSSMMNMLIEQSSCKKSSIKETIRSLADASLSGARGNSGVIFSQFFNGLSMAMDKVKHLHQKDAITINEFSELALQATEFAEKAVEKPKEGTIITVMRDWGQACKNYGKKAGCFNEFLASTLITAKDSLASTTEKLKALKDNHVVDSGAQGFVYFLEGLMSFLKTGKLDKPIVEASPEMLQTHSEVLQMTEKPHNRYCTEALLQGEGLDIDSLRSAIKDLGDSMVIAGHSERCRLHIHTNHPEEVFDRLPKDAILQHQKVDDMLRQYEAVNEQKAKIAVVTDSIADICPDIMNRYQIHLVPLNLIIKGNTYLDRLTITPNKLLNRLNNIDEYPTSSQPNYKVVESLFSFLKQHYDSIIVVSVAKKMSGTFNLFQQVANHFDDYKISIVDSKTSSGAQGLITRQVAEMVEQGLDHDTIVDNVESFADKTNIYVSVHNFDNMIRSGRINPAKGVIARFIKLKPIVSINEKGKPFIASTAFTEQANQRKLASLIVNQHKRKPISEYCITHVSARDKAEKMAERLTNFLGFEPTYIAEVAPVTTLHAGVGCVSVSTLTD